MARPGGHEGRKDGTKMLKPYDVLSESQKEEAREAHPLDFAEWWYNFDGVELTFSAK